MEIRIPLFSKPPTKPYPEQKNIESMNANMSAENSNSHLNGKLLEWFMCVSKVDSF